MITYFRKGRHRLPSNTSRRVVTLAAAVVVPMIGATGTANAAPDWGPIVQCESGGNARAKNPNSTASGLYQFINGTWRAYGGLEFAPTARQATVAQQTIVANRAYAAEGFRPWNESKSCWSGKTSEKPTAKPVEKKPTVKKAEATPKPPVSTPKAPRAKPVEPKAVPVGGPTASGTGGYAVVEGDTLTGIAAPLGMTWEQLYEKNRDVVEHPDWIWPGEKLAY